MSELYKALYALHSLHGFSKRYLGAAIHKKIHIYDVASASSDPVSTRSRTVT